VTILLVEQNARMAEAWLPPAARIFANAIAVPIRALAPLIAPR
jgi:hypothetical protein